MNIWNIDSRHAVITEYGHHNHHCHISKKHLFHHKRQFWRPIELKHELNCRIRLCNKHRYGSSILFGTTMFSFKELFCIQPTKSSAFGWRDIAIRIWCLLCSPHWSKQPKTIGMRFVSQLTDSFIKTCRNYFKPSSWFSLPQLSYLNYLLNTLVLFHLGGVLWISFRIVNTSMYMCIYNAYWKHPIIILQHD